MSEAKRQEIEAVLDQYVRPLLRSHGGEIRVVGLEGDTVRFRLTGQCSGCAAADITASELVESELTARVEGIAHAVLERETDPALLQEAARILAQRRKSDAAPTPVPDTPPAPQIPSKSVPR